LDPLINITRNYYNLP